MRMVKSEIYFPIIIGGHLVLWALDLAFYNGSLALNPGESVTKRVIGEVFSSWVVTVFGFNLLMATRARWVERIFGGLDKMYLIHRRAGVIAMVLLLLHFGVVPRSPEFSAGKLLGFAAMALILIGVILAGAPFFRRRIPYHKWVLSHRLLGPVYVVGVAHSLLVPTLISRLLLVRAYVLFMAAMGILSWLYIVLLRKRVHAPLPYEVASVRRWGLAVIELTLRPKGKALEHLAGQFASFTFPRLAAHETHPFTIANAPGSGTLRVVVKASGDFTAKLVEETTEGDAVLVEGPYGHLTQDKMPAQRQIWIAGGVGITPFLALAGEAGGDTRSAALYWSVRTEEEAFFDEELKTLADDNSELEYTLWRSNEQGYLAADRIREATKAGEVDVLICGPVALRDSLTKGLRKLGIPASRIHSEEFSFR